MPTYELKCKRCDAESELICRITDYDQALKKAYCKECHKQKVPKKDCRLERHYRSLTTVSLPAGFTYDGNAKVIDGKKSGKLRMPINIIDEKPDGGYKVTRIGNTKADIEND